MKEVAKAVSICGNKDGLLCMNKYGILGNG